MIVTGAARGIGLEVAGFLHASGRGHLIVDFDGTEAEAAGADTGATAVQADVTSTRDVSRAVQQAVDTAGRIDGLVNNAGMPRDGVL